MKPFPQSAQLDRLLHKGLLSRDIIIDFANYIADFHQCAQHADSNSEYGTLESISLPVDENFKQIKALLKDDRIQQQVDQLEEWSKSEFIRIQSHLLQRKLDGFIRECHGDLHLRNLAWMDGQALAFDCIEFDPKLYWIDVISDLAFLWMDLLLNRREDLAWALLNQYLSRTGDYAALALLRFYSVYRALVRAKIAAITLAQSAQSEVQQDLVNHLDLAQSLSQSQQPTIFLMHGPSGSGKSTLSQQLVAPLRAVILRSDVERKRLYHLRANHDAASVPEQGIYTSEATRHTYQYLLDMARLITAAGYSVIVDATFNQRHQRALFTEFARTMGYPCRILDLKVSESNLRQRILQRENDVSDADLQVLEHQLKGWQALSDDEQPFVLAIDLNDAIDLQEIVAVIQRSGLQL
jgi:uncharacterized protein